MAHLDVHPMPGKGRAGCMLDVQSDTALTPGNPDRRALLPEEMATVPIRDLNPVFEIRGQLHVMLSQAIAAIPGRDLKRPVASLVQHQVHVTRVLEILLVGF